MFESGVEQIIVGTGVVLFIALAWYMNTKFSELYDRIDQIHAQFHGLREYLYEIDPQFDEERQIINDIESGDSPGAGMEHSEYISVRKAHGKRTLHTPFMERSE